MVFVLGYFDLGGSFFLCNDRLGRVSSSYGVLTGRIISNQQTKITPSFVGVVLSWFHFVIVGSLSSIVESRLVSVVSTTIEDGQTFRFSHRRFSIVSLRTICAHNTRTRNVGQTQHPPRFQGCCGHFG